MNNHKNNVGAVSQEEKNLVQQLYERNMSLECLLASLEIGDAGSACYTDFVNAIKKDMNETKKAYDGWWDEMRKKYNWNVTETDQLKLDFYSNIVTIDN